MIAAASRIRAVRVPLFLLLGAVVSGCMPQSRSQGADLPERRITADSRLLGEIGDTKPRLPGRISIQSVGSFDFDPAAVATVRADTFREGFFSIFDILVHLDGKGQIELEYHFDPRLDTHVIDKLNGEPYWWYRAFYDGGWTEDNVFRMDLFPYKDRMQIRVFPQNRGRMEELHDLFREETAVKRRNGGSVVVREVIIRGPTTRLRFEDVEVTAHDLRSDVFQEGVVTAVDVIMSLGDQGLLSYDLQWHESIGEARIVQNYFVQRINEDRTETRCGFVYEAGALAHRGRGNHIHLPPDTRVIHAPEYVEFFWICV